MSEYMVNVPLMTEVQGGNKDTLSILNECVLILSNPADYCKRDFSSAFYTYCHIAIVGKAEKEPKEYPDGVLLALSTEFSLSVNEVEELLNEGNYGEDVQCALERAINSYVFAVIVSEIAMAMHLMYKDVRNWVDIDSPNTIPEDKVDEFLEAVFVIVGSLLPKRGSIALE